RLRRVAETAAGRVDGRRSAGVTATAPGRPAYSAFRPSTFVLATALVTLARHWRQRLLPARYVLYRS
ncbi:MAG: hypothetical protein ACC628_00120, partial [Pirellulaceae bacterium]